MFKSSIGVAMPRVLLVCAVALTVTVSIPALPAHAQSAVELKQLKAELEAQRKALDAERKTLEEQRRRLDETIQRIESLEAEKEAPAEAGGVKIAPTAALTDEQKKLPNLEIYGFAQVDAIKTSSASTATGTRRCARRRFR
jgi:septal ring factor EnvC (AmiA/AmiB activator)